MDGREYPDYYADIGLLPRFFGGEAVKPYQNTRSWTNRGFTGTSPWNPHPTSVGWGCSKTKISDIFYVDNLLRHWSAVCREIRLPGSILLLPPGRQKKNTLLGGSFWKGAPSLISFLKGGALQNKTKIAGKKI